MTIHFSPSSEERLSRAGRSLGKKCLSLRCTYEKGTTHAMSMRWWMRQYASLIRHGGLSRNSLNSLKKKSFPTIRSASCSWRCAASKSNSTKSSLRKLVTGSEYWYSSSWTHAAHVSSWVVPPGCPPVREARARPRPRGSRAPTARWTGWC